MLLLVPNLQPGTYVLGPDHGTLAVRTGRTGAAAKAGHNLLLHVTAWTATLEVGAEAAGTSLALDVDGTSLRVREGTGGMQALGDDDKANIEQTIDEEVLMGRGITFRSTEVQHAGGGGLDVRGELTLLGRTHPLAFRVAVAESGTLSAPSGPGATRRERNSIAVPSRTSSSIVWAMFALSSSPSACMPPVPSRTRSERASAVSAISASAGVSPTASVARHEVTSIRRLCPAFDAAPALPVRTVNVASSGPSV